MSFEIKKMTAFSAQVPGFAKGLSCNLKRQNKLKLLMKKRLEKCNR
jgi:hypothetical protein